MTSDKQWQKLQDLFQAEAAEYLDKLNQILLQLETANESQPNASAVREMFRVAHSLKGAARTVDQRPIEQIAHVLETVFDQIRDGKLALTPTVADVLYDGLDSIQVLLSGQTEQLNLEAVLTALSELTGQPVVPISELNVPTKKFPIPVPEAPSSKSIELPSPAAPSTQTIVYEHPVADETIRVTVEKLDVLMTEVSNLLVSRMNIEERVIRLKDLREQHHQWQKQWRRVHTHYIRLIRTASQHPEMMNEWRPLLDFLQETQRYMRVTGRSLAGVERALNEDSLALGFSSDALQASVRNVRLLPFETIVGGLQRMTRDVARELGKEVLFHTVGTRIELDKQVLEQIRDPLVHILRNAVDHGIETPETRTSIGKPPQGLILLTLMQRGSKVHIIITDDGRGVDLDRVRGKALQLGLINDAEAASMNEPEVLELLMQPGMSTTDVISSISGRGVGLDVVRQNVEQLQGQVRVESRPREGTTFEIILPVSLSTLHCLLVKVGPETYAIPITSVVRVADYAPDAVYQVKGKTMITLDSRPMPLGYLEDVLERGLRHDQINAGALVLVLSAADRQYAFVVDDVIAEQEVVVRSLNPEMARVRNVSGATLLGNGEVVIILNVGDLLKSAQGKPVRRRDVTVPEVAARRAFRVLVVDDSITTRTLQKNILEAAGYDVFTATHGIEGLDLLTAQEVDLVITDIEMPWMNGFELTSRIRKHPQLKNLPVILVTSLDSAEHKERGFKSGADAYIVKGVFDQNELLKTIQTLL